MKKLFALLLTLVMLLSLAACTPSGGGETTIVGTWTGSMDMSAMLGMLIQTDVDEDITCKMIFTFSEDGKFTAKMDEKSALAAMDAMVDVMIDIIKDAYAQQDMDLEEMLAAEGMTMADLKEQYREQMDLDDMFDGITEEACYKYENGKIYIADSKEDLEEEDYATVYIASLAGKTLTITDIEADGESAAEMLPDMFPMIFKK